MKIESNRWPYIVLFILILILIFISGVKYGGKVEQMNEKIRYVLSITPTQPTFTPTPTTPISFSMHTSTCGVSLTHPDNLKVKESTNDISSIELFTKRKAETTQTTDIGNDIEIHCILGDKTDLMFQDFLMMSVDDSTSTSSAMILDKDVTVYKNNNFYFFKMIHPDTEAYIGIKVSKELFPLIQSSLKYSKLSPQSSDDTYFPATPGGTITTP